MIWYGFYGSCQEMELAPFLQPCILHRARVAWAPTEPWKTEHKRIDISYESRPLCCDVSEELVEMSEGWHVSMPETEIVITATEVIWAERVLEDRIQEKRH